MDLHSITLAQLFSYTLMMLLLARAFAHAFEARARTKRLKPVAGQLTRIGLDLEAGHISAEKAIAEAQTIVARSPLEGLFSISGRIRVGGGIQEQVDEKITVALGRLHAAATANEAAGPRYGLALTALGIVLRFTGGSDAELSNVGIALVTTGLGMLVAVIEAWTLNGRIEPLADEVRRTATRILVHAAWPTQNPVVSNTPGHPLLMRVRDYAT